MDVVVSREPGTEDAVAEVMSALQGGGYSVWSSADQADSAAASEIEVASIIADSKVLVVLLTRQALRSERLDREITLARDAGKPFVPLMLDLPYLDVQNVRPLWSSYFASTASLRVEVGETTTLGASLLSALESLGVEPSPRLAEDPPSAMPPETAETPDPIESVGSPQDSDPSSRSGPLPESDSFGPSDPSASTASDSSLDFPGGGSASAPDFSPGTPDLAPAEDDSAPNELPAGEIDPSFYDALVPDEPEPDSESEETSAPADRKMRRFPSARLLAPLRRVAVMAVVVVIAMTTGYCAWRVGGKVVGAPVQGSRQPAEQAYVEAKEALQQIDWLMKDRRWTHIRESDEGRRQEYELCRAISRADSLLQTIPGMLEARQYRRAEELGGLILQNARRCQQQAVSSLRRSPFRPGR